MSQFTLDNIRQAAEAKYGSVDIAIDENMTCRLLNPLRLPKEKREALVELQKVLDAEDTDQEATLSESIRIIAEKPVQAEALLDAIGDDLTLLAEIFETYSKATQVGEASPSQD